MSQPHPESSKDRALQEALGGHVAFDDKAIVNNIFHPSEVDNKTVTQILNTLNAQQELRKARDQVLQERRVIERQKYWSIMKLLEHISTYDYKPKALQNDKYAEVIQRRWKATHSRNIGIDPGIYLPSAKKHFEYDYSETSSAEDDRLHFESGRDDGGDGYSNHSAYTSFKELLSAARCATEGLEALHQRGVLHRDVSIGNVFIGTDRNKAAGFVCDLDLSSISPAAIKAAYPEEKDHEDIIARLEPDEWPTGTPLFMPIGLLSALRAQPHVRGTTLKFTPDIRHDLESLIWVVVYAMMVHRRNVVADIGDQHAQAAYQVHLDRYWSGYSHSSILDQHAAMYCAGTRNDPIIEIWFRDSLEAAFFRDAMYLVRGQNESCGPLALPLTPEMLCNLFDKHLATT